VFRFSQPRFTPQCPECSSDLRFALAYRREQSRVVRNCRVAVQMGVTGAPLERQEDRHVAAHHWFRFVEAVGVLQPLGGVVEADRDVQYHHSSVSTDRLCSGDCLRPGAGEAAALRAR
jgi:hypothetical protein